MDQEETLAKYNSGREQWNEWAVDRLAQFEVLSQPKVGEVLSPNWGAHFKKSVQADFSGHTFEVEADFSGYIFPGDVIFGDSTFEQSATFEGAVFHGSSYFSRVTFDKEVDFSEALFRGQANFSSMEARGQSVWKFTGFEKDTHFTNAKFENETDFSSSYFLSGPFFSKVMFYRRADFSGLDLTNAHFTEATLENANFSNCQLGNANFEKSDLKNANLLGAHTNTETNFLLADVENCQINRFALDCLEDFGGLSKGAQMRMAIHDDVATLRKSYSGFFRWSHLIAMLAFVFPYAWFLISRWSEATFFDSPEANHIALWEAFLRYIVNGGVNWQQGYNLHWSCGIFVLTLMFNVLRGFLLVKTKNLEFHQEVTGFPADFSLSDTVKLRPFRWSTWNFWFQTARFTVWAFYLVVALNAYHFLSMQVPLTG